MTSSPVKEINSLMNFAPAKAKGNLQENLAGNFSDAFSKASGQQSMTLQKDTTVQGNTKVQVQNTDRKGLEDNNTVKTGNKEVQNQDAPTDKQVQEEAQKAGEELVGKVAEELGVSEEEVIAAMEILGLTMADLLNADNMTQLVLTIEGEDMISLMTDEGLYNSLQNLLSMASEAVNKLETELGISPEELEAMLEQAKEAPEMVEEEPVVPDNGKKPEIPDGEEDYTVTVERNGETVKVSVEVDGGSKTENTEVTGLKPQAVEEEAATHSGKEEGAKRDGSQHRENTQETSQGNMLLENLLNRSNVAKTDVVFENTMAQSTADTQNIMNQIMDYMKLQFGSDTTSLEMQLHPASLGTLHIQLESKGGMVTANFITQNEAVKAALESQIVQLQESFEAQGVRIEAIEVTVQTHEFERNLEQGRGREQQEPQKKNRSRRINLIDPLATEGLDEEETLAAEVRAAGGSTVEYAV